MAQSKLRAQLSDILTAISWGELSREYFGKSPSWLYHKLDGIDGNGGKGGFSPEELDKFKNALCDLADRIKHTADSL